MLMKTVYIRKSIPTRRTSPPRHGAISRQKPAECARAGPPGRRDYRPSRHVIDTSTLTVGQTVRLCRANRIYVSEIRFPDRVKRRQQKKFAAFFDAIGADGRAELCRCIGVRAHLERAHCCALTDTASLEGRRFLFQMNGEQQ